MLFFTRPSTARLVTCLCSVVAMPLAAQAVPGAGYHVTRQLTLGGEGRWDYLVFDTTGERLFIARQNRIMVVDPATGRLVGEISGLDGAHGVALAPATGHGFATSGHDGSAIMFDLTTLRVIKRTKAARDADAVLYDPASKRIFTFNGDAGSATALDANSGAAVGSIPLGGKPEFGVTDGAGRLYVNIENTGEVAELDPVRLRVTRRWSIAPCDEPTGLAIDLAQHRLFSVCDGVMAISDAIAGRKIAEVPIGQGVDGAAFDPSTGLIFSSNGEGSLTVVHEDSPSAFRVVATVPTRRGARTLTLDPRSHRLYTVTAAFGPTAAPTSQEPHPRPSLVPGTFSLLELVP